MLATQIAAAIDAARTPATLDALAKAVWSGLAGGHIGEDDAQAAALRIEGRRGEFRAPFPPHQSSGHIVPSENKQRIARAGPTLFSRARTQRPPDRTAALARRRHLAASGPMPPALAASFTTGELAVLRIVADEARDKGRCDRTFAELAARAGVGRTTAQNALRRAARLGLVHVEVRPRPGRKHLANVVTITSREWRAWIERKGQGRGAPAFLAQVAPKPSDRSPLARIDRVQKYERHGHQIKTRGFSG